MESCSWLALEVSACWTCDLNGLGRHPGVRRWATEAEGGVSMAGGDEDGRAQLSASPDDLYLTHVNLSKCGGCARLPPPSSPSLCCFAPSTLLLQSSRHGLQIWDIRVHLRNSTHPGLPSARDSPGPGAKLLCPQCRARRHPHLSARSVLPFRSPLLQLKTDPGSCRSRLLRPHRRHYHDVHHDPARSLKVHGRRSVLVSCASPRAAPLLTLPIPPC